MLKDEVNVSAMSDGETAALCAEIREKITDTVSKRGGHLASNLGMVEATVALHRAFDFPHDKIIFDVGHQCYAHKLLTGRADRFDTLRQTGGISGFSSRDESEYDVLSEGHSGSSVSAAVGIAEANRLSGSDAWTVAVVGDGSLTNGMIYEAFNNCGGKDLRLVIVINDNQMSISKNIGGLHNYLSKIRTSKGYLSFKHRFENFLSSIPLIGDGLARLCKGVKNALKRLLIRSNFFEDIGLVYLGPVDGHDVPKLTRVLKEAKTRHGCSVVHIKTVKGKGYAPAEAEPDKFHSTGPFDRETGRSLSESGKTFSHAAGELVLNDALNDKRVCAITAAMCDGTGLSDFAEALPDRFFDVGIAEEHAVTFASGLSVSGFLPVVFLYSTFSQRVFDQIYHDVALQKLPMILMLDRCGIVPGDGITHQGIFDVSLFTPIPGITVYSPETYAELAEAYAEAKKSSSLSVIRYPRGGEREYAPARARVREGYTEYTEGVEKDSTVIITYGRITSVADGALTDGTGLIKLIRIFPLDTDALRRLTAGAAHVYVLEEGERTGGIGDAVCAALPDKNVTVHALDGTVPHGDLDSLYKAAGFTPGEVKRRIENLK